MKELLWIGLSAVSGVSALITLPGSTELFALSLASLVPARTGEAPPEPGTWRVAVVIPAHNEATTIASCVKSLLLAAQGEMFVQIYVIADNCNDDTAAIAKREGAFVIERTDAVRRGKGYALHFAFDAIKPLHYDCVLVVDADTEVSDNFVSEAAGALQRGAEAVQARYLVRNADEGIRTRLMGLALRGFNIVRPLGRDHLGLSVGILGNGFGLRTETIEAVPYQASSIVEDLEYHLALVRSGRRVRFLNDTAVYGEMPVSGKGVETQRARWEGGRLRMLVQNGPGLLGEVLRGRLRLFEPLFELLLLPLSFHAVLVILAVLAPLPIVRDIGIAGLAIIVLHLIAAIRVGRRGWEDLIALAVAPFYVIWKLLLIPSLLRSARSNHSWIRTSRNSKDPRADK